MNGNWIGLLAVAMVAYFPLARGSETSPVVPASFGDARQPQAAVDSTGRIHVVFGSGDSIHYCRSEDGLAYINCGDWVESCTAVVEQFDGRIEIVDWADVMWRAAARSAAPER